MRSFATTEEFLQTKRPEAPGCIVLDVRLPGRSGLDFQHELIKSDIRLPVIFITGHGDVPMSVKAIKAGAIEFLTKPFREQDLLDAIHDGIERDRTQRQDGRGCRKIKQPLFGADAARARNHAASRQRPA